MADSNYWSRPEREALALLELHAEPALPGRSKKPGSGVLGARTGYSAARTVCCAIVVRVSHVELPVSMVEHSVAPSDYDRAMSKLLLNLRNVLEDEADDVRALLQGHRIEFYETQPSRWGISHGGIWISDEGDVAEAKRLMATYQAQRQARVRAEHAAAQRDGTAETFRTVLREQPGRVLLTALAIVVLLGLVALPALLLRY